MGELSAGKFIGTHEGLTGFDRSLLWVLTSYLHYGGKIKVQQVQLAADMESSEAQISRSIARLVKAKILKRDGAGEFKLNENVGQMGARLKKVDIAKAKGWETIDGGNDTA